MIRRSWSWRNFTRSSLPDARVFFEETLRRDIVRAFRELQDAGLLEIIASAATHAFLPLLQDFPEAQRAQIRIGCDSYRAMFGREPSGFWLPECGYQHGLDSLLQEANIRWFVLDTHGLMFARPRTAPRDLRPLLHARRSRRLSRATTNRIVKSGVPKSGYPGDPVYRDFYRDIGFDRTEEELRPFLRPPAIRKFSGIKYHRVTGRTDEKELYHPAWAMAAADAHARRFSRQAPRCFRELKEMNFDPIDRVSIRRRAFWPLVVRRTALPRELSSAGRPTNQADFQLATPSAFLAAHPSQQVVRPNPSSWGEEGFNRVWLEESNAWIYPHLHAATRRMTEIARRHRDTTAPAIERALQQAARELLLAQASDWAFLIKTRSAPGIRDAADERSPPPFQPTLRATQRRTDRSRVSWPM